MERNAHNSLGRLLTLAAATALIFLALISTGAAAAGAAQAPHRAAVTKHRTGAAAKKTVHRSKDKKKAAKKKPAKKKPATKTKTPSSTSTTTSSTGTSTKTNPVSTLVNGLTGKSSGSIYWGAIIGSQFTGNNAPWDMNALGDFEQTDAANKHMGIIPIYQPFMDCSTSPCSNYAFPSPIFNTIRSYGSIPMVSWSSASLQTQSFDGVKDSSYTLANVVSGKFDSYITQWAEDAKAWGHPFFLRFDWEMNGDWFAWGGDTNSNSAAEYVAAWRHVHDIFTKVGATNATWVWCPNNGDEHGSTASMASFYPGNSYVDWTCMDAYNFGTAGGGTWNSWDSIAQNPYNTIQGIAPSKPMMIGEFASGTQGGSQAAWLTQTLADIPQNYPNIHAIILTDSIDQWQLEGHPLSQAAFSAGIQNPAYTSANYSGLNTSPIPAP